MTALGILAALVFIVVGFARFGAGFLSFLVVFAVVLGVGYISYLTEIEWIYIFLFLLTFVAGLGIWANQYDDHGFRKGSEDSRQYAELLDRTNDRNGDVR
jgi:hypothetical protein